MKVVAEILSQGDEVLSGQVVDRNAAWLSERLTELGFEVKRHNAAGDCLEDLVALIREIAARADCCIGTGGLGPTCDDLTAEAAGIASGLPLVFDAEAFEQIQHFFSSRGRSMPESNRKQAMRPKSAVRIDNPLGTAPGFALKIERCWFVFLPGVPPEMKAMFEATVRSQLLERFQTEPNVLVTLRTVGIGESMVEALLQDLKLPDRVKLGFRAAPDEVQTKLLFPPAFPADDRRQIARQVADKIGDHVFSIEGIEGEPGGDLIAVIDRLMSARGLKLAVLESASGGLLAAKCQERDWLAASFVAKDIELAARQLRVELENDDPGQAGRFLAFGLSAYDANIELVQLYRRDHDGYRLYNYLQAEDLVHQEQHILRGGQLKQNQAALLTLNLLRRYLQNQCR